MGDDVACPRCKTTKYRNPSLRLMVNVCGHALCESCVELMFVKGSAVCAECGVSLRRVNYRAQLFDDPHVEREVDVRKRVLRDYNKREENFASLREYNDYLEEIEDIVFNLTGDVDVDNTKRRIDQYRRDNRAVIARNKGRPRDEQLDELIDLEQQECVYRQHKVLEEHREEVKTKTKNKEALIDELMFSDAPAGVIVATHAAEQLMRSTLTATSPPPVAESSKEVPNTRAKFSTGIKFWQADSFLPLPKSDQAQEVVYKYDELSRDLCGPKPPAYEELTDKGYLQNTRKNGGQQESAAGFLPNIACYRALEEAFCGLFHGGQSAADRVQDTL